MTASLQQLGLTPAKGALVLLLGAGLGVVWGPQLVGMLGSGGTAPVESRRTPTTWAKTATAASRSGVNPSVPRSGVGTSVPAAETELTTIALAEATSYDPFAAPAWSPASRRAVASTRDRLDSEAVSELDERFKVLRESGVAMILVSESSRSVQIGDQTLQVGDQLEGFEIVEISTSGVVFQPASRNQGDG